MGQQEPMESISWWPPPPQRGEQDKGEDQGRRREVDGRGVVGWRRDEGWTYEKVGGWNTPLRVGRCPNTDNMEDLLATWEPRMGPHAEPTHAATPLPTAPISTPLQGHTVPATSTKAPKKLAKMIPTEK